MRRVRAPVATILSGLSLTYDNPPKKSQADTGGEERLIPPYDSFNELSERYIRQLKARQKRNAIDKLSRWPKAL